MAPSDAAIQSQPSTEPGRPWVALASFPAVLADGDERPRRSHTVRASTEPGRPWVALASFPAVLADGDERPRRSHTVRDDVLLAIHDVPRLSYLLVLPRPRLARPHTCGYPIPYIHAASASGLLLFEDVVHGIRSCGTGLFLYDAKVNDTRLLPDVPFRSVSRHPRSLALIADRNHRGHHVVGSLHPMTTELDMEHLFFSFSTAIGQWTRRTVAPSPRRRLLPLGDHGVIAHDDRLWWVCLAHGLFGLDPFSDRPELRFVRLPPLLAGEHQDQIGHRRCVTASEGKLLFVQVTHGVSSIRVAMFTLDCNGLDGANPWILDLETDIHNAGPEPPLRVALVDSQDRFNMYVFQGTSIFALLDMRERRLVACSRNHRAPIDGPRRSVVHTHAWPLPPLGTPGGSRLQAKDSGSPPIADSVDMQMIPRTPAVIQQVKDMLPAVPGSYICRGKPENKDQYDRVDWSLFWQGLKPEYDASLELIHFKHPKIEDWNSIWRSNGLCLHDANLVAVYLQVKGLNMGSSSVDMTDILMGILKNHPGPVNCFRLDTSRCPTPENLLCLIELLSKKDAHEIILLNLTCDYQPFPFSHLRSAGNLTRVTLGFFHIKHKDFIAQPWYSDLTQLTIIGCTFVSVSLSIAVSKMSALHSLVVGISNLSHGLDPDDKAGLTVSSDSLVKLQFWDCRSTGITLLHVPRLDSLAVGVSNVVDGDDAAATLGVIDVDMGEAWDTISDLSDLDLQQHNLIVAVNNKNLNFFPRLKILSVKLSMPTAKGIRKLVKLLNRLPLLESLTIKRVDRSTDHEDDESPIPTVHTWIKNMRIKKLTFYSFTGGNAEASFVSSILFKSPSLTDVEIHTHPSLNTTVDEIRRSFMAVPRASAECEIMVY